VLRGPVNEVPISYPRAGIILNVDWGIRRLSRGSCARSRSACPRARFLGNPSHQSAPHCVNPIHARREHRALFSTARFSRIPPNCARLVVSNVELLAAHISWRAVAGGLALVFTSDHVGVCMDDKYSAAHSGHSSADSDHRHYD
jgi:hypothetical protein